MRLNNLFKYKELINFWIPFAIIVVIGRRIFTYGLTLNIFKNDFFEELFIGLTTSIIIGVLFNFKNSKKE